MEYIKIAKVSDLDGLRYKKYQIMARNLAIFREPDGTFYAIEFSCKHQNWDLSTGKLEGDILTCPRHGWVYDVRNGDCLTHDSSRLRRYGLKVEGEDIYITPYPIED